MCMHKRIVCGPALCTDVCAVEALWTCSALGVLWWCWGWEQAIHTPGDRDANRGAILPVTPEACHICGVLAADTSSCFVEIFSRTANCWRAAPSSPLK